MSQRNPTAEITLDDVAFAKILHQGPMTVALVAKAEEMAVHLRATVKITGDNNPRRVRKGAKNAGQGYHHNAESYKVLTGFKPDGNPVAWMVSFNHFTMLEYGSFDGKQPARHYLSTTLILFRV